ncbi:MAG TPA: energy-coupling factor transporter transmembrane component T [Cellulomonas sp.]
MGDASASTLHPAPDLPGSAPRRTPGTSGSRTPLEGTRHVRGVRLDPRTLLGLLVVASALSFAPKSLPVEVGLVLACAGLQLWCGQIRLAVWCLVGAAALLVVLEVVLPSGHAGLATTFTISLTYARKVVLCGMVGAVLVAQTSVHRLVAGLRRLHLPQAVLIPFGVTLRYFPTLRDEARHIRDAMRLRDIPAAQRLECLVVPLIVSATSTADELSRAATCRGIENPARDTDTDQLAMRAPDRACLAVAGAIGTAVVLGGLLWA